MILYISQQKHVSVLKRKSIVNRNDITHLSAKPCFSIKKKII